VNNKFNLFFIIFLNKFLKGLEFFLRINFHSHELNKGFFGRLLIRYIYSNHDKRILYIKRQVSKKNFRKKEKTIQESVDMEFLNNTEILYPKDHTLLIYLGDSLIEYLSRVKLHENSFKNSLAYWLGPKTRMGFNQETELSDLTKIVANSVQSYIKGKSFESLIIVWSSGSIDVRCSVYELKLRKLFSDDKELAQIYRDSTENLIQYFIKPLSKKLATSKIVFLSELDSSLEGETPKTVSSLKKIKKNHRHEYPSFGNLDERSKWRKLFNKTSSKLASENNFMFLDLNPYLNKNSGSVQFDGVHISDPTVINKINNKIIGFFE
jgi:hypothetical protein